jgi:hypothetical protein
MDMDASEESDSQDVPLSTRRAASRPKSASVAASRVTSPKKGVKRKAEDSETEPEVNGEVNRGGENEEEEGGEEGDGDVTMRPPQDEEDDEDTPNGTAAPTVAGDAALAEAPGESTDASPEQADVEAAEAEGAGVTLDAEDTGDVDTNGEDGEEPAAGPETGMQDGAGDAGVGRVYN